MTDITLAGCTPEPLAGYLAGIGVLRIVAEQVDAEAEGWWTAEGFMLRSLFDAQGLADFVLQDYVPTPLVSPWNKGSGLRRDGRSTSAEKSVAAVEASDDPRLGPLRTTIAAARRICDDYPEAVDLDAAKAEVIGRARSDFPDDALPWIDAAVVLTSDGPVYPHILGTGGNLGRLDLTANALSHLLTVLDTPGARDVERSRLWLAEALFGTEQTGRLKASTGQYDPGHAGGVNQSSTDDSEALVNPWGFLLAMEGAVLLASGASRRLSSMQGDNFAAMPFTVRPSTVGTPHLSAGEQPKGELWLPLWSSPVRLAEVRRLFGEGRLQWGRRNAVTALDAVRAVTSLGAERGVNAFTRVVIAERLGKNPLAVSGGRVVVRASAAAVLTRELDPWVAALRRRGRLPGALTSAFRTFEKTVYATTAGEDEAAALQDVLAAVAQLDRHVGQNRALREHVRPLPPLDPDRWLPALDDGSAEFAVAAALASLRDDRDDTRRTRATTTTSGHRWRPALRDYLRPVAPAGRGLQWHTSAVVASDGLPVADVLSRISVLHATLPRAVASGDDTPVGAHPGFTRGTRVERRIAEAFAAGVLDDLRIARLLAAMVLLRPSRSAWQPRLEGVPAATVPGWRFLAPLFGGRTLTLTTAGDDIQARLFARRDWPAALRHGATRRVLEDAATRYRVAGLAPRPDPRALARGVDGFHVGAALLLPLARRQLEELAAQATGLDVVDRRNDQETETQEVPA